jgi:hypothetical protein
MNRPWFAGPSAGLADGRKSPHNSPWFIAAIGERVPTSRPERPCAGPVIRAMLQSRHAFGALLWQVKPASGICGMSDTGRNVCSVVAMIGFW